MHAHHPIVVPPMHMQFFWITIYNLQLRQHMHTYLYERMHINPTLCMSVLDWVGKSLRLTKSLQTGTSPTTESTDPLNHENIHSQGKSDPRILSATKALVTIISLYPNILYILYTIMHVYI